MSDYCDAAVPAGWLYLAAAHPGAPLPLNHSALDTFLAQQERRAFKMALVATRNPDEALDIVQDAMLKLATRYAHKSEQDWGPLFTRILQNAIKNWYRHQSVRQRFSTWFGDGDEKLAAIENVASEQPTLASSTEQSRFAMALERALQALPRRQQQVFLLRAVEGLDVRETAAAMACSQGSVKTHYSRALQRLKTALGEFDQTQLLDARSDAISSNDTSANHDRR